ncbi:bifunctional DNA-binding transcriptional regulator/antitoxin component of YhaV-PrlF toxin-antitoxin module [Bacillus pakistanensis]|uniref:Bifunctional DNA-binding transcriptional regulator/antitoxin component of YhaV-PrlF toxin-antitoxin module n=1 Tax=Rossellomorea pakistanensis TaxID=992288 RepID=A0ABS2NCT0_9BACI|nr:bifunctional DNA-binding transcriptional regulator/antitoxin component of YhaV-PrlF toxin-antitoxin module [Bacillus pakistanensis]
MKSTGIVRKVDELGRVVLPVELRRNLEIGEKREAVSSGSSFMNGPNSVIKKLSL